tara:strand:+ start:217 stop:471 length:255 start_codon:yes stop_codon:yes gene_type:complete
MKKIKLCIAGLLLSGISYGQAQNDTAEGSFFMDLDSVSMSKYEVVEIMNSIDYVLSTHNPNCNYNIYLTRIRNKLYNKLNGIKE